jgi:hypothetical protein
MLPAMRLGCCLGFGLLLVGCASYESQTGLFRGAWNSGSTVQAAQIANREVGKRSDSRDAVVWFLEQGAALRADGQFAASNLAFEQAERRITFYDRQAEVRLSREAGGLLTNLAALPYEGRGYDRVMLNTYQALNYLQLGKAEAALIELRQAHAEQDAEVVRNARRIVAARKSAGELERAIRSAKLDGLQPDLALDYGVFINPFTDFLHALCLWSLAADGRENALVSLRRVHESLGRPPFLSEEIEMVDRILSGAKHPDLTYVIFETGGAPIRREVRLDVPLHSENVPYVAAAFPRLEPRGNMTPAHVAIGGAKRESTLICDMDAVVARDFRTGLPAVILRTLAASAAKAAISKKVREESGDLGAITGFLYQAAGAQADLRTWTALPKTFRVCRVKTPTDRKLTLLVGSQKSGVTVNIGRVNVVCVKGFAPGAPLKIQQFRLK